MAVLPTSSFQTKMFACMQRHIFCNLSSQRVDAGFVDKSLYHERLLFGANGTMRIVPYVISFVLALPRYLFILYRFMRGTRFPAVVY